MTPVCPVRTSVSYVQPHEYVCVHRIYNSLLRLCIPNVSSIIRQVRRLFQDAFYTLQRALQWIDLKVYRAKV